MARPCFIFVSDSTGETELFDLTEYISELNIVHNDVDAEGSGRDTKTGKMKRTRIAQKHNLNVKLRRVTASTAQRVFNRLHPSDFYVKYAHPCTNGYEIKNFYCSSVNYGAQRYDRNDGSVYYDGASFNCIEM